MNSKKCNYCGEEIKRFESRCPYCGSLVEADPVNTAEDLTDTMLEEEPAEEESQKHVLFPDSVLQYHTPPQKSLGNGFKVFLTSFSTLVPGLGQLVGLIAAIVFMNSEEDADKRSFGLALMITSLVVFIITFLFYSMLGLLFASLRM